MNDNKYIKGSLMKTSNSLLTGCCLILHKAVVTRKRLRAKHITRGLPGQEDERNNDEQCSEGCNLPLCTVILIHRHGQLPVWVPDWLISYHGLSASPTVS